MLCSALCVSLSHCVLFIVKAILKLGFFHFLVCPYLLWNITLNFFILASFSNTFTYLFSLNAVHTKSLCHQEYSNFHITLLNWPVPFHPYRFRWVVYSLIFREDSIKLI